MDCCYFRVPLDRLAELQATIDSGTQFAGTVEIDGWGWKTALVRVENEPGDGLLLFMFFGGDRDDTIPC